MKQQKKINNSDTEEVSTILKMASNEALALSLMLNEMSDKEVRKKIKYIRVHLKRVSLKLKQINEKQL